jgi:serine protease
MTKIIVMAGVVICISLNAWAKNNNGTNQTPSYKAFHLPENITEKDYQANVINFRIKPQYRGVCAVNTINNSALQLAMNGLIVNNVSKVFPRHAAPENKFNAEGLPMMDLSLIYRLSYNATTPIDVACNNLLASGIVEYAEPNYVYYTNQFVPNDPNATLSGGSQSNFLNRIKAFDAWDLSLGGSQGDTTVVIGIVDTGSDLDHPDLQANIKLNYADPVNGTDDDADGYIDNYFGWDLSGALAATTVADNNPTCAAANDHGSHVSGCASEVTNNGVGGAGIGFKTKLLIVKCSADDAAGLNTAYEGITYAADHGCQIINCSWGGEGGGSFGQNIVDYATNNKNALVVVAAGNSNVGTDYFPACYNGVLNVAASNNNNDTKASFSNFNYTVGVTTPGNNISATVFDNAYTSYSGTSMASPITAGACALVKAKYPTLTASQIKERIRVTADPHYSGVNATYKGRLGKGRLNVFRALTDANVKSVRFNSIQITDNNDDSFVIGDTLNISGIFKNYLEPTSASLTASIYNGTSNASYITLLPTDTQKVVGAIASLGTKTGVSPYRVKLNAGIPANTTIVLKLVYRDGAYYDEQYFPITVNVDYLNVRVNEVFTTVTSKGREFYNSNSQADGLGFVFKDSSLAYEGGFMIGAIKANGDTVVVDNVRGTTATPDENWKPINRIKRNLLNPKSAFDAEGSFNDFGITTVSQRLNVNVSQKFYAFDTPGNRRYVIYEYTVKSTSAAALNNFYASIFTDWDINNAFKNKSAQDPAIKLGYSYSTNNAGLYAGVKVLTNTPYNMYACDNNTTGGGPTNIQLGNGYSNGEKYKTMIKTRTTAGDSATGTDVINIVSTGPFTLNTTTDSVIVAFAIVAGENQNDLVTNASAAQVMYDLLTSVTNVAADVATDVQLYPNPANATTQISIDLATKNNVKIELYNIKGELVQLVTNQAMLMGTHLLTINTSALAQGTYYCKVITGEQVQVKKLSVIR